MKSVYIDTRFTLRTTFILFISLLFAYVGHGMDSPQPTLDFIYIDSSVDESAGGHTAVRFDQTVFHYQYHTNGLFLLVKENWLEFLYAYNNLQNRTISLASLPLSSETYQKIKTQFLTRYLLQEKRLFHLAQLKAESVFFKNVISSDCTIPIKGLGFFSLEQKGDSNAVLLRASIENRFGASYLEGIQQELESKLKEIVKHLQPTLLCPEKINIYTSSIFSKSKVDEYFELREFQEALRVLTEARPVVANTLVHSSAEIGLLTNAELERLRQYRETIKYSILHILTSSRPDKGSALMLQTARFQALCKSLELGYLITLDPFSEEAQLLTVDALLSSYIAIPHSAEDNTECIASETQVDSTHARTYFEQIRIEQLQDAQNARYYFFSNLKNEDISFNQLETSLGRFWEINHAKNKNGTVRVEGGVLLPSKVGKATVALHLNTKTSLQNIALSQANKILYKKQLYELYDYNLISRNCVTELFETIYSSFLTTEQAINELGGYLNPREAISFIPFYSFYLVKQKFPQASIEIFPSFRKRQLNRLYRQGGFLALLKESNTLTSTIYFPWEGDSSFLFFTDDVVLTRPLLGAGNTMFAAVNMIGGIVWSPIDEGRWLRKSVRGVVFSLPELAFFNIRKGTFPAVAFDN
jgi:hypothetical protein